MNSSLLSLSKFWSSSIGKKVVVALTGLVLSLFLAGHLSGNLLLFVGDHAFNEYAHFLHNMLHGAGVWIARIVLLTCLVLHVVGTIQLTRENRAAGGKYQVDGTQRASKNSQMMIWSGLTILAFIVFHILHYTVRVGNEFNNPEIYTTILDGHETHNAYKMVVDGFSNILVSLFYIIAVSLLCGHLSHGVASIFQTLGLRSHKTDKLITTGAKIYALVIWLGFISIPIAVLLKIVK